MVRGPDWATTNPLVIVLWGIAGGIIVAIVLFRLHPWSKAQGSPPVLHDGHVSIDMINASHLQVVGFGGFMIVVMCAMVAVAIPPVGLSFGAGALCGTIVALVLIRSRGKAGPMSSSSHSLGANTTFELDGDESPRESRSSGHPGHGTD